VSSHHKRRQPRPSERPNKRKPEAAWCRFVDAPLNFERLEARIVLAALSPAQVTGAYGIGDVSFGAVKGDGAGQTIAIIDPGDDPSFVNSTSASFSSSDLAKFDKAEGLPDPPSFAVVGETGGARPVFPAVTAATESGSTVTITTDLPTGLSAGSSVNIKYVGVGTGAGGGYNGTFTVLTTPTATSFTYTDSNTGLAASSGGTVNNPVDSVETAGDIEWAHSIAPGANIVLVEMTGFGSRDIASAVSTAVPAVGASVVSMSFGGLEYAGETSTTTTVSQSIASATESGNTVTITTGASLGVSVGNAVTISGVGVGGYNGSFQVASVSGNSFTYSDAAAGLAASGGGTASTPIQNDALYTDPNVVYVDDSGDNGAPGWYSSFSPNVLSAGATNLFVNGTSYGHETGWSNPGGILNVSQAGNVVTVSTDGAFGFTVGSSIRIAGVGIAGYNGTFTIASIPNSTSFTYVDPATGLAPSVGGSAVIVPPIVDNSGSGFAQTGTWTQSSSAGYQGNYQTAAPGANTATWTLSVPKNANLGASLTWVAAAGNATNATYSFFDGAAIPANLLFTTSVDQTAAPNDNTGTSYDPTTPFQKIASFFQSKTGTITVQLNASGANGTVCADAVAISSDTNSGGTGGGISQFEPQPSYQAGAVNGISSTHRTIPDVSFVGGGETPVSVVDTLGGFTTFAGTSLSTPCWAGLVAIADQGLTLGGLPTLNSSNQTTGIQALLYNLPATDFHDITSGFNGYSAGQGYDLDTGLGSPIGNLLVPDLAGTSINYTVPSSGSPHQLVLRKNNANIELLDNGIVVESQPESTLSDVVIDDPNTSNDALTVDYAFDGIFAAQVSFTGNPLAYDTVKVNAPSFGPSNSVVLNESQTSAGQAAITLDGAAQTINLQNVAEADLVAGPDGDLLAIDGAGGKSGLKQVDVTGGIGNDKLTVDSSAGLASFANGIHFSGGGGFDELVLQQSTGNPQSSDTYSVGPNNGQGSDVIIGPSGTQTVDFQGLAPVVDTVPSPMLVVNATPASNAINYTNGTVDPANDGEVTIDNQESIEFSNKTNLTINGQAGDDAINLNYQPTNLAAAPFKPTGLTSITVNGGDPTASDTLIVNGVTGARDDLAYSATATGAGSVGEAALASTPATMSFVPVTFSNVEQLSIVGQSNDHDSLHESAPVGTADDFEVAPGPNYGGTITGFSYAGSSVFNFVPLTFYAMTGFESVEPGGTGTNSNIVTVDGDASQNTFAFGPLTSGGLTGSAVQVSIAQSFSPVFLGSKTTNLVLRGFGGNNTFDMNFATPLTGAAGSLAVSIEGAGSTASADIVNYTPDDGTAIAVNLGTATISATGSAAGSFIPNVTYSGVGNINLVDAGAGFATLGVTGTAASDTFLYTPTGATAGTFQLQGAVPVFTFAGLNGALTFIGGGGTNDQLYVYGTSGNDTFTILEAARTVGVNGFKPATLDASITSLSGFGLDGDDTFVVTPADLGHGGLPVNIDGGNPAASDALIINAVAASQFVVVNQGRGANSGTVRVFDNSGGTPVADPDVSYQNVEIVSPNTFIAANGAPNLLVMGPDDYELNNFLSTAAFLGSGSTLEIEHASIFPNANENGNNPGLPADQDYYRVVAQQTGTLDFQVYFSLFAGLLPAGGNLNAQVLDAQNQVLGTASVGPVGFGALGGTGDARVRIPVVAGQSYYLRVYGIDGNGTLNSAVVNGYSATIINTPPPVPYDLELSRSVAAGTAGAPDTGDLPANAAADDTGRSQFDNVTNIQEPTIYVRLADGVLLNDLPGNGTSDTPPAGVIPIPFSATSQTTPGYNVAIFDGNNTQTPVGFASQVPGFPGLYSYTFTKPLVDGIHNIVAAVQMVDPQTPNETGFGADSTSLELTIDHFPPPLQFGITSAGATSTGLAAGSDSGALGTTDSLTLADRITNQLEPTFYGTAEANAIVKLYALDKNGNPVLLGQTTATPIDGTNADPSGQWTITSTVDLDDPAYFSYDGLRTLYVTGEDLAGNVNTAGATPIVGAALNPQQIRIFVDTQGPQIGVPAGNTTPPIQIVSTGGATSNFNLFGLKSGNATSGPTPLVDALTIHVLDDPTRDPADFPNDPAILADIAGIAGQYELVGDATGVVDIASISVVNAPIVAGQPATATVTLHFAQSLADDRYTLTIKSTGLVDPAGNDLDGESNAIEPNGSPIFPSGDGQPGGDFSARFTVDSRPEVGTYAAGSVYVDINGNMTWDPTNTDATNRDLIFTLGLAPSLQSSYSPMTIHDAVVAGDFLSPAEIATNGGPPPATPLVGQSKIGYDKLAAYGYDPAVGGFRWLIDTNSDGVIDPTSGDYAFAMLPTSQINGVPLTGDFALNPAAGDQIGLFDGKTWYLDTSTTIDAQTISNQAGGALQFSTPFLSGSPVVGDFNGATVPGTTTPIPDLATYLNGTFHIVFGQYNSATKSVFYVADSLHEATVDMSFAGVGGVPVAADMNQDGFTDLGVYEPRTTGTTPQTSEWYWLISNPAANPTHAFNAAALNHPFSPAPLGDDIFADFGEQTALPIVGNFDPPVSEQTAPAATAVGNVLGSASLANQAVAGQQWYSFSPLRSGDVSVGATSDSLTAAAGGNSSGLGLSLYDTDLNLIASGNSQLAGAVTAGTQYLVRVTGTNAAVDLNFANHIDSQTLLDSNGDGIISPLDALLIINDLNTVGAHAVSLTQGNPDLDLDTNLDGMITSLDALQIINALNAGLASTGSAVSAALAMPSVAAASSATAGSAGGVSPAVSMGAASVAAGSTGLAGFVLASNTGDGRSAGSLLATDAVFAALAASDTTPSATPSVAPLQSKAAAPPLSSGLPAVRKPVTPTGAADGDLPV
jgi:hypothetical protein